MSEPAMNRNDSVLFPPVLRGRESWCKWSLSLQSPA